LFPNLESLGTRMLYPRTWLLTWTTYGTWLPGDQRGFVSPIRTANGERKLLNHYGEEPARAMPGLVRYARSVMTEEAVQLSPEEAGAIALQCRETGQFRKWNLLALAIMRNHIHLVVSSPETIGTAKLIGDFKAYSTRRLNSKFGARRWWTERGSGRLLPDEESIERAILYVLQQDHPLIVWSQTVS
jgi:REP element-mobilizing transposase RayT